MINNVLDNEKDAVLVCNEEGVITHANNACNKLFGYEPKELLGQKIEVIVPEEVREKHVFLRTEYMKNPEHRSRGSRMGLRAQHKNGEILDVDVVLSPLVSIESNLSIIALVRDISNIEDTMKKLKRNLEQLSEIEAMHGDD